MHVYEIESFIGNPIPNCHDQIKWVQVADLRNYKMPLSAEPVTNLLQQRDALT